jgi:CubicO group peptidase (beta-lactamase class C family)
MQSVPKNILCVSASPRFKFIWLGRIALIGLISVLVISSALGEPRNLDPTLRKLIEKYQLPGAVGAIIQGDRLVAVGSAGVRKMGDASPFLSSDTIHLGSDTKAMTAVLIGQLIDQKKLSFNTTLRQIFPDLAGKMNSEMAAVTVRDLLDHNAGLPHDLNWRKLEATRKPLMEQRRVAVELAIAAPPATAIGSYSYSNAGYMLLGAIVEQMTGKPWEDVIQREIFDSLKMKSAGFGFPGRRGQVDQPWGHILKGEKLQPVQSDNALVMAPAGCVRCTIEDWARFVSQVLSMARGQSALVSSATFKQLITPMPKQEYAGGWIIAQRDWAGGLALTHSGSNTTWFCTVWIAPEKNFAVLIAINDGAEPVGKAADEGIGLLIELAAIK